MLRPALLALILLLSATARAETSQQPFFNVITLETSATAEVPTDTLTITLFTEEQGADPTELAARVNTRLEQAMVKAKSETAVQTRSGNYQTNPLYDRANQVTGWRIRAELTLESRDFKAAGTLASRLQPAMKLSSMAFSLSRAAREKAEAALLAEALTKYQAKAQVIAKTLGFPGYTISQVGVRSDFPIVQPMAYRGVAMAAMADTAPAPPVPAEGGKNAVTVTVTGSVVLGPGK
jgi:predicted secreted protein